MRHYQGIRIAPKNPGPCRFFLGEGICICFLPQELFKIKIRAQSKKSLCQSQTYSYQYILATDFPSVTFGGKPSNCHFTLGHLALLPLMIWPIAIG